jgi:pyruvate/2-oxoglutarate dehydrogenase complex dihydrolipoamide acyltransferase (E2) component
MALVSITDAAKLVRKTRAALERDIEKGRLNKTVLQDGDIRIDTADLIRAYGPLPEPETETERKAERKAAAPKKTERAAPPAKAPTPANKAQLALHQERIRALERVVALEAELRRTKDQVTQELRARLAEKDQLIKTLESKILFLEYDRQVEDVPTLSERERPSPENGMRQRAGAGRRRWWSRLIKGEGARAK